MKNSSFFIALFLALVTFENLTSGTCTCSFTPAKLHQKISEAEDENQCERRCQFLRVRAVNRGDLPPDSSVTAEYKS